MTIRLGWRHLVLLLVAGAGLGLFIAGRASVDPVAAWPGSDTLSRSAVDQPGYHGMTAAAAAAAAPYSDCSLQPGQDAGHDVTVEFSGPGATSASGPCQAYLAASWNQVLAAPGSVAVCTLSLGAFTAVVWDTGGHIYGTQECTSDLPGQGWSPKGGA